jgi:endonuclease/exonuclease/phosphatase (EEP) superfamily protein YafD
VVVAVTAVGYLLALLALVAAFWLIGERWWVTATALYLPRIGWALPLPFLIIALLLLRSYWLLLTQLAALVVVLFPLMGMRLNSPRALTPGAMHFRIFTLNIGYGQNSIANVLARIRDAHADVIVLEAVSEDNVAELRAGLDGLSFQTLDQFVVASRFPVDEPFIPAKTNNDDEPLPYMRCRVHTPMRPIRLYATHPTSPHSAFNQVRGEGLRDQILSGRAFQVDVSGDVERNALFRVDQVRELAEDATLSPDPVLIAGDTNLPGLSWAFAHWLGGYQDAFAEAGFGFGYTYPAHKKVWMRIDRILGGPQFRFLAAAPLSPPAYQHLGLVAEVEIRP